MAEFTLEVGQPRVGWISDGDESTPIVAALLENDGSAITLRIPWTPQADTAHVERWFGGGINWGDDPDQSLHRYEVPDQLWFRDHQGTATLVGARSQSSVHDLVRGGGLGTAYIDYAVIGSGGGDYNVINGMRSELSGLLDWVGQRSVKQRLDRDGEGRVQSVALMLESPEPIVLSRRLNLRLRPQFTAAPDGASDVTVHDATLIETNVQRQRSWLDHLIAHNTVRDLLEVATWSPCEYERQWVQRTDDPLRVISGAAVDERWARVRTYRVRQTQAPHPAVTYLFRFDDIGTSGFRRWERLRRIFARGINPLLATLDRRNVGIEANLALSCIGLDGIGYQLALEDGLTPSRADKQTHRTRFLRVVSEVSVNPPLDPEQWAQRASDASNGIKHANRDLPDYLTMANTLRENGLVFRLWVAKRLGVPKRTIDRALSIDPTATAYEAI